MLFRSGFCKKFPLLLSILTSINAITPDGSPPLKNLLKAHAAETKCTSKSYDYIIAGGGLAGCVLAERLTSDGKSKVLMLEAGRSDYNTLFIRIPAGILRLFRSVYDWQYETSGEEDCEGRNIYLQRGMVLGGSSCTNVLLYHRGSAMDYDSWKVPGWTSSDVLPFFKLSEDDKIGKSSDYHSKGGEWTVDQVRYQNPLSKAFLTVAHDEWGLPYNDDFNNWSRSQEGIGRYDVNEKNGERVSGASGFLSKAIKRKNLTVRSGAMVRKIEFDESKTAKSITYDLMGDDTGDTFSAKLADGGEVIVTGGAIASPQILMCSGIGPRKELESLGINVIADLDGVGQNLQDHPAAVVSFTTPKKGVSVTSKLRLFGLSNPFPLLRWLLFKTGLLTSTGCDHGAFIKVGENVEQPNLQLRFLPAKALTPDGMTTFTKFRTAKTLEDGYSFQSIAVRSKNRGEVKLASSNTHTKPIIDLKYLHDRDDLITLREGIKLTRKLGRSSKWNEYLGEEVFPGPEVNSDEEIEDYIRRSVHTSNALTGTCKMGLGDDCVVTPDLKVRGVQGVRVADSSILPQIIGGQTATPTVMIAEKAAAFLKAKEI